MFPIDFSDLMGKKNLLGFSGGTDSMALFFLLLEAEVAFDIAMVDYGTREQAKLEVAFAKNLAENYHKEIFILQAEKIFNNFENEARKIRYKFFEKIIQKRHYHHLILGHQLNDRLEWFLMQLIKGSSIGTLLGFDRVEQREGYKIIRPLYETSRDEILTFLGNKTYFKDRSNEDLKFLRNKIRHQFSDPLMKEYKEGILKSFRFLLHEKQRLYPKIKINNFGFLFYFAYQEDDVNLYYIDMILKQFGYVLSQKQRKEIIKQHYHIILAGKFIIEQNQHFIFITKQSNIKITLPKSFKNFSRKYDLPVKLRGQVFTLLQDKNLNQEELQDFLSHQITHSS